MYCRCSVLKKLNLLIENKLFRKSDILIGVKTSKKIIINRLKQKQTISLTRSDYIKTLTILYNFFKEFSKTSVGANKSDSSYPKELSNSISYISKVVDEVIIVLDKVSFIDLFEISPIFKLEYFIKFSRIRS